MNWINVKEQLPEIGKQVLLLYTKKKASSRGNTGRFIIQGSLITPYQSLVDNYIERGEEVPQYFAENVEVMDFRDYTNRDIQCNIAAENKKGNVVTHWAVLPEIPEL